MGSPLRGEKLAILAIFSIFWAVNPRYSRISMKFGTAGAKFCANLLIVSPLWGKKLKITCWVIATPAVARPLNTHREWALLKIFSGSEVKVQGHSKAKCTSAADGYLLAYGWPSINTYFAWCSVCLTIRSGQILVKLAIDVYHVIGNC